MIFAQISVKDPPITIVVVYVKMILKDFLFNQEQILTELYFCVIVCVSAFKYFCKCV